MLMKEFNYSERAAYKLLNVDRSSYRYEPKPDRNEKLRQELIEIARQKPRYGYRRLHVLLERRGWTVNHKRLYRLYRKEKSGGEAAEEKTVDSARRADRTPAACERRVVDGFRCGRPGDRSCGARADDRR